MVLIDPRIQRTGIWSLTFQIIGGELGQLGRAEIIHYDEDSFGWYVKLLFIRMKVKRIIIENCNILLEGYNEFII